VPPLIALIPALGLAAAMAVYAFEPVRSEYADRWRARAKSGS
jgi:hypothetical protein